MSGERAVVFGADRNLVGILTEPEHPRAEAPVVLVLNAGIIHRVGPSRFTVDLTRELTSAGYRTLRFDLSGIGDSDAAGDGNLAAVVQRDIRDAVTLALEDGGAGVVLTGLCSGADNAFFVAADDPRVRGLVLIDPGIPRTRGFLRRRALHRLGEPTFWWRLLSGRTLLNRFRPSARKVGSRPPGYYGLLRSTADEAQRRASVMTDRGVQFLYVLTGGVRNYCNSPAQVTEAMPCFNGNLRTEWREEADHLLSRARDRSWLNQIVIFWLEQWVPAATPAARPTSLV